MFVFQVLVVGNPANTNAMICKKYAPSIPAQNFSALTRLDQNRAQSQVASKAGVGVDVSVIYITSYRQYHYLQSISQYSSSQAVQRVVIWGNHSSTQYPDARHGTVTVNDQTQVGQLPISWSYYGCSESFLLVRLQGVYETLNDEDWLHNDFISTVQQRGAAVIKARKLSSAMSAAKAICDHMRDWWFGTGVGFCLFDNIDICIRSQPAVLTLTLNSRTAGHRWA